MASPNTATVSPIATDAVDNRPTLTANELRWLAEAADGTREKQLALVINSDGKVDVVAADATGNDVVLLNLKTTTRGPGIPGDAKARVQWHGRTYGGPTTLLEKADAVFLTQSAVEKFLLPYYMRFRSGAQVQALENALYNDPRAIIAFHIPPSSAFAYPIAAAAKLSDVDDNVDIETF